jgi:hypothetical protein
MHKTGNVIIHDNTCIINECLFDSGAKYYNHEVIYIQQIYHNFCR